MNMNELHMGVYINHETAVHRLSEKIKIPVFTAMTVLTLVSKSAVMYGINLLLVIVCAVLSKMKISEITGFFKRLWIFLLVILVMNMLFYDAGNPVFTFGIISISKEGLFQGLQIVLNVVFILLWANILLATTSPIKLMQGIRFYLSPLKYLKVPIDDLTLIISVSIQFIPILIEEAASIKKAQTARGAEFESRNLFKRSAAILPLIIPIFIASFKRADELSQALEARGYQGSDSYE